MRGYGSTADRDSATPPPRDGGTDNGSPSHATPQHHGFPSASLPRNESAGGTTTHTSETDTLLGEQLLLGEEEGSTNHHRMFLPSDADASTIERVGSDGERDDGPGDPSSGATTPRQSGSPRKKRPPGGRPDGSDPHIGLNVVTNVLDSLAYSRDPDESTLLTNDFTRRNNLSTLDEEDGRARNGGLLRRLFARGEDGTSDPPYMLVCLGLAVGVGLCSVVLLAYVTFDRHQHIASNGEASVNSSSSEGTWHGVPFEKIGRESFGDPVSSFLDVDLFHPSLLFGGRRDGGRRRLAGGATASPRPFLKVPFPTGAFWTNLVLLPKTQAKNQYSYPVVAYPYAYQWSPLGKLQASYSASRRVVKPISIQDGFAPDISVGSVEDIRARHVVGFDPLGVTLRFNAGNSEDSSGNWETYLVQGSPYVTAKYSNLAPELTALSDFEDITCPPTIEVQDPSQLQEYQSQQRGEGEKDPEQSNSHQRRRRMADSSASATTAGKKLGICAKTTNSSERRKIIRGVQFIVTTKEQLTWLVFASEPITLEFHLAGSRRTIQSREKYSGVIRLALVPPPTASAASKSEGTQPKSLDFESLASSSGVKRLIYHAGAYPVGGTVSWDFRSGARAPIATSPYANMSPSNKDHARRRTSEHLNVRGQQQRRRSAVEVIKEHNIGTVTFAFDTKYMTSSSPNTNVQLLMLSLPHHAASISSAEELILRRKEFDLSYESIKGRMVPVVGNAWSYEEELTFVGFGDESLPAKTNLAQHSAPSSSAGGAGAASATSSRRPVVHESTAVSTLDQSVRDLLLQTAESDLKVNLPDLANGAYGFGKQVARVAQLAHIAELVDAANVREVDALVDRIKKSRNGTQPTSDPAPSTDSTYSAAGGGTARRAYALLEKYLTMWLTGDDGGGGRRLAYDAQLGGVLSSEGMSDMNADFGNARYNDHHFHYGYVLYAAAVLGRANPKFVAQCGPFVDALFYDVAHAGGGASKSQGESRVGDRRDIFFPLARHKSWFDGHSFASGLFPFADGKSQESSSEAVNCYYGAYLWSRVRWGGVDGDRRMVDYARLLLATEMTGAKAYWHMTPPLGNGNSDKGGGNAKGKNATMALAGSETGGSAASLVPVPFNSVFRENYMVGNLGMTDVTCTTWFGTENIYVHLINFMPVTAITAELFDKGYVKGEQSVLRDKYDSVENAWKGYSICNEAILDPNNAWIEAQTLISGQLDPGLSKSQVLFWASTREGFSPGTTVEVPSNGNGDKGLDSGAQPSNVGNSDVAAATAKRATGKANENSLASCTSHEKCVAENLLGSCCPTNEGVFLRCCT